MSAKRYHPLIMILEVLGLVKSFGFIALYLFVIQFGSDSSFVFYGRIVFLCVLAFSIVTIFLKWQTDRYEVEDETFHLYSGIFTKSKQTIPFSRIQNVNRRTTFIHKLFKMTSLQFETSMSGDDASIEFKMITKSEAELLEDMVKKRPAVSNEVEETEGLEEVPEAKAVDNRIIHFTPTRKDLIRASFTSLSFLLLIPVVGSLFSNFNEVFSIEEEAQGLLSALPQTWWFYALAAAIIIIASVLFGVVRTFLKYGNYVIASDEERIYITKGVLDETAFSISKSRVQAIEMIQTPLKRILGLAEVKLTSAGGVGIGEENLEINSLYPFLPVQRANEIIEELLPAYSVTKNMKKLPRKSFWIRLLRPSWIWIIATIALFIFKPEPFDMDFAWWLISILLLVIIAGLRVLDYLNSQYVINDHFIQMKSGSLSTTLFVTKRDKIIEINVTRGFLHKKFGLATIGTVNRSKPVHHSGIDDIPDELAARFMNWYRERRQEITIK
ncbi:PH domain-containing protein [Cytobacillus gottheilii]|uniref:PH domain-containing protein n=1 Tax=Cytobacillus gottheilii TaxID=859144 RepID=UPI003CF4B4BC